MAHFHRNDKRVIKRGIKSGATLLLALMLTFTNLNPVIALAAASKPVNTPTITGTDAGVGKIEPLENTVASPNPKLKNTYILSVSTGTAPGKQILYFSIRYKDENNVSRTHYILMGDNELQKGYNEILSSEELSRTGKENNAIYPITKSDGASIASRLENVKAKTGYSVPGYPNSIGSSVTALSAGSVDHFIVKTEMEIKAVENISFFVKRSGGTNEWHCNDMRLYKVNNIYGLDMFGYYSAKYFIKFDGEEIAAVKTKDGFYNFTWNVDKIISIYDPDIAASEATKAEDAAKWTYATPAVKANAKAARVVAVDAASSPFKIVPGKNKAYSNVVQKQLYFQLGFEDIMGGGIESLVTEDNKAARKISTMNVAESIILSIIYNDVNGDSRRVELPFITSAATWAASNFTAADETDIIGLAQQGESLGFVASLPDFASLVSYQLDYGDKKAGEIGIVPSSDAKHNGRLAEQKGTNDTISLAYFSVYDADKTRASASVVNGSLNCTSTGDPSLYFAQKEQKVILNGFVGNNFKDYPTGLDLEPKDFSNAYLVKVTTDDIASAATASDITMKLGYVNTSGVYNTTDEYSLRDLVSSFYGYWPGGGTNIAYNAALSRNSTLYAIIYLNDVEKFENVTFVTDGLTDDDWQFNNFEIDKVSKISKRGATWIPITAGNKTTDRTFFREITSERIVKSETTVFLKGNGDTKELSFTSKTVTEVEEDNWKDNQYSMSYEDAIKNLGFAKTKHVYNVQVKVGNDKNLTMSNDACGSKNLFYFQLLFKGGRSGYVLANQQISSDGFRAGVTESFSIATNQNYGELVSVSIIADDMASNSDVFDKLKIDNITVTKESSGGLSRQWGVKDVGWISIDYRDEGESSQKNGRPARSEAELARNYAITSRALVMNMLFTVSTSINTAQTAMDPSKGDYVGDDGIIYDKDGNLVPKQKAQFQGAMMGVLEYYTSTGEFKTHTFDVVDAMYNYAYKQPKYLDDNQKGDSLTLNSAISDPAFMFRKNHTDRFVLSLDDVARISTIKFLVTGLGGTTWYVNNVSVSLIDSDGTLGLNAADEYERNSQTRQVAVNVPNDKPYDVMVTVNKPQELKIPFVENSIKIDMIEEEVWSANVTRVPETTNDVLNVFVYTNKLNGSPQYSLSSGVKYTDAFGNKLQTSSGKMGVKDGIAEGEYVYYAMGMSADNMSTIDAILVDANSKETLENYAKEAIVQRVRSGVLIETYRFTFPAHTSSSVLEVKFDETVSKPIEAETQTVTIQLGTDMADTVLVKQNKDIAVAISYISTADVRNTVFVTPYKFVTEENYRIIKAGDILTMNLSIPYLKEIVGLKLVASGGIKIPVQNAYITTYVSNEATAYQPQLTNWYSFPYKQDITASSDTRVPLSQGLDDKSAVTKLDLTLKGKVPTAEELLATDEITKAKISSLGENPIKVTVGYVDKDNLYKEEVFSDIRKHKAAETTIAKTDADGKVIPKTEDLNEIKAQVLLQDVKSIRGVFVEPYDDRGDNTVSIYLEEVAMSHTTPSGVESNKAYVPVGKKRIVEGQDNKFKIGTGNIAITVDGKYYDYKAKESKTFKSVNDTVSFTSEFQAKVTFTPKISGSIDGFDIICETRDEDSTVYADCRKLLTNDNGTYTFAVPLSDLEKNIVYRLSVVSKEDKDVKSVIMFTIPKEYATLKMVGTALNPYNENKKMDFVATRDFTQIVVNIDTPVTFTIKAEGITAAEYTVSSFSRRNGKKIDPKYFVEKDGVYTFTPPKSFYNPQVYAFTVKSNEHSAIYATFDVKVIQPMTMRNEKGVIRTNITDWEVAQKKLEYRTIRYSDTSEDSGIRETSIWPYCRIVDGQYEFHYDFEARDFKKFEDIELGNLFKMDEILEFYITTDAGANKINFDIKEGLDGNLTATPKTSP